MSSSAPQQSPDFPPELLELIFSYLLADFELELIHACTLVSRAFHNAAQCFLYTHASFRHPRYCQLNTAGFLRFRNTVTAQRYGETIQSLSYSLNPQYLVDLLPHLTRLRSLNMSALHEDYHILTRRQPGQLVNALRNVFAQPNFRALKISGYYIEDGFNTLNYLLKDARWLEQLALSQLKVIRHYPKEPTASKGHDQIHLKSLSIGFPFPPRRDDPQHWSARTLTGYWLADYFGLRLSAVSLKRLEDLTVVNGGIFEMRRLIGAVGPALRRLKLEGNVHVDSVQMPRRLNGVVFDDWIKMKSYSRLTSLSLDFRGNVYGEDYKDMKLMLRWLTNIVAPALPQRMPKLQNLLLKFRIHTLRIKPHVCRKNYRCREDDPRDGLGYWSRLGLMLNRCDDLEMLRIEIDSVSYYGLSISKRSEFTRMIEGAVLNNGLPYAGYRVEVDLRDSLDTSPV
ncbi:hypothetical protein D9756_002177 [Leucocoprinus leucothites]|uniref:F-box domain-containing protein n=1 Tax=Leucocoprinus leucothites TaxID=201217 RepID=A0A8H5LM43_9AGAR|nr:hypothetical protein D9756_002177 [Leucoagaricus leucothites]